MYDVIILGAGPAGLMAGRSLKDSNLKYLIIDSREEIGNTIRFSDTIREEDFLEIFKTTDFKFIKNKIESHEFNFANIKRELKLPFLELDAKEFFNFLAEPIKDKIKLNLEVEDINITDEQADIKTSKGIIRTKLLILTYSHNFKFQKKFGPLNKETKLITLYGETFNNHKLEKNKFYLYLTPNTFNYFWAFPKNEETIQMGYAVNGVKDVKDRFEELAKTLGFNEIQKVSKFGGIFPLNQTKSYSNRVLITETASAFLYPFIGEGLNYSLKSGKIAGDISIEACKNNKFDEDFLKTYETVWKKEFQDKINARDMFREISEFVMKNGKESLIMGQSDKNLTNFLLKGRFPLKTKLEYKSINSKNPLLKIASKIIS